MDKLLIIGLTGASGIQYAIRLLNHVDLVRRKYGEVAAVYTDSAVKVARVEAGIDDLHKYLEELYLDGVYGSGDWMAPIASSSRLIYSDMVIVPASMNTVAKLASGIQDNLLLRAASSILRLRRRLVVVFRETPLSPVDLENLYRLAVEGAIILPASPGFYGNPRGVEDLLDFIVGKIMDVLGIENNLYRRWRCRENPT